MTLAESGIGLDTGLEFWIIGIWNHAGFRGPEFWRENNKSRLDAYASYLKSSDGYKMGFKKR
ncbi:Uncharacterized protein APZ42_014804 [Daphnia magna]|uniref:Uncharacterized protein n=1 Tax=Daphnia magna TaxID=35525 RepID=A0A0P6CS76_9CRUS|nr:Uncharacterized protein APZ42_014804 [Daphnia magna]